MDYREPFLELEPPEREDRVVQHALNQLFCAKMLPHTNYDERNFLAHRRAIAALPDRKWTAISPRMQRFLYALNAITTPRRMIAAGVFWGNTFLSNAGAAVGPGKCYEARDLVGVEIDPEEAARAERNLKAFSPDGPARIVTADAVEFARGCEGEIDLLYLDADGAGGRGKGVYLDILEACIDRIPPGGLVLAHNSVNGAEALDEYLRFVRDPGNFRESVNVIIDPEGLEVSLK
jgi:predicted O-methyltransferase YrrM